MGLFGGAPPPEKFGGQKPRTPFFELRDAGVPTPQRGVEVRRVTTEEGIFAVSHVDAKATVKAGATLFIEVTCLVPPYVDNMPTMNVGDVRLVMGSPGSANPMGWQTCCNLVAAAFGVPVAPEMQVAGIERVKELIGRYPKRYTPEDWSDDQFGQRSPEDDKALAAFLGVAIRDLADWASESEGERLTAKTNPDGTGILAIALAAKPKYGKMADDPQKSDFSRPTFGPDGNHIVYVNTQPRRMDDALNLALAQALDGGHIRGAAKTALNAEFLAGVASAYAEYKAAEAGA